MSPFRNLVVPRKRGGNLLANSMSPKRSRPMRRRAAPQTAVRIPPSSAQHCSLPMQRAPFANLPRTIPFVVSYGRTMHPPRSLSSWSKVPCSASAHRIPPRSRSSDWFGDSKLLRAGAVHGQLLHILRAISGGDAETTDSELFARFGIEENPYTSHVVAFVPFVYYVPGGTHGGDEMLDYPWRLFNRGEACVLSLETVRGIERVELRPPHGGPDCRRIVTSEHAAPFRGLVSRSVPAVYTEGYPNFAVQRLLRLFAKAGLRAEHAGDGDLDGYRIADLVASCIPVDRIVADDVRRDGLPRRQLSASARTRLESWLAVNQDSPHASALRETISIGWLEQESFPLPSIS